VSETDFWICLTSGTGSATAASIFEALDGAPQTREIPWVNSVCLSVDNTSVNMGKHNSLKTRATQKNPSIYTMGCPSHIILNTAQQAGNAFREVKLYDWYYYRPVKLFTKQVTNGGLYC
jgi:hypothetical protein